MAITPEDLVRREVYYCVSSLVSTLASSYAYAMDNDGDLPAMIEQAFELSCTIDDWEEAATQEGWTFTPYDDASPAKSVEPGYWKRDCDTDEANDEDENGFAIRTADNAQEACELDDIEPYRREVFEHWIVSDWLADKLEAKGEKVDRDFAGMIVWARTTTGQAIAADPVIQKICDEMNCA